jgi:hypothetical protein
MHGPAGCHVRAGRQTALIEPFAGGDALRRMSNRAFLVIVGTIIIVLMSSLLIQKYEDCAERGGKACPRNRFGVSFDASEHSAR